MRTILGIDLGTSSVKAMLLDVDGGVVGVKAKDYGVDILSILAGRNRVRKCGGIPLWKFLAVCGKCTAMPLRPSAPWDIPVRCMVLC